MCPMSIYFVSYRIMLRRVITESRPTSPSKFYHGLPPAEMIQDLDGAKLNKIA